MCLNKNIFQARTDLGKIKENLLRKYTAELHTVQSDGGVYSIEAYFSPVTQFCIKMR